MPDKAPMVSVVMPTFNRASLLPESVRSILGQHHRPIEIIIVDDGSTDSTPGAVDELVSEARFSGVEVCYYQQQNKGASAARNKGLSLARGEFVQFLDSDDLLHPRKLALHVDQLLRTPDVAFVFSDMVHFMERPAWESPDGSQGVRMSASELFCSFRLLTNVGLYRRSLCEAVGPWNEALQVGEDIEYSLRAMLLCNDVIYLPGYLSSCREHAGARLTDLAKDQRAMERRLRSLQAMWAVGARENPKKRCIVGNKLSILYFRLILDATRDGRRTIGREATRSCELLDLSASRRVKLCFLRFLGLIPHCASRWLVRRIDQRKRNPSS